MTGHRNSRRAAWLPPVLVALCGAGVFLPSPVPVVAGIGLLALTGWAFARAVLGSGPVAPEPVTLAVLMALGVPALGALALHVAGVPLRRESWVVLLVVVWLLAEAVSLVARRRGTEPRADDVPPPPDAEVVQAEPAPATRGWQVRRTAMLGTAVAVATGAIVVSVLTAQAQNRGTFTELWAVPDGSRAQIGVRNDQEHTERYELVVKKEGTVVLRTSLVLASGAEKTLWVSRDSDQELRAQLYLQGDPEDALRTVTLVGSP